MATLAEQEIEQQQLKEKTKEVKEIYDKLVEAGSYQSPTTSLTRWLEDAAAPFQQVIA